MLKFILTLLLIIPIIAGSINEWSYDNIKQWSRTRKNRYCAGNLQSPIDLRFNVSRYDGRLKKITLDEPSPRERSELVNNGHTAQLSLKNQYLLKNVAPGSEDYKVEQLHFHWGHSNDNTNGSEHLHEGQSYPLEMHIVSYSSWYSSINDAMTNIRGLAVVGIFFEVTHEPNPLLEPLIEGLRKVRGQNQKTMISEEFNLKALIGEQPLGRYYRYDGSLTTPPCFESVIWSVLLDPLKLSLNQLHDFRYLHDDHAKIIQNTYRPVQSLGSRVLFRSFLSKDIAEDIKQRASFAENNGQYLINNMKLIIGLLSLLIIGL